MVAFLFGITSHMVADVSWHSLGIEQGFLRTMGAVSVYGHEGATVITPRSKVDSGGVWGAQRWMACLARKALGLIPSSTNKTGFL